MSQKVFKHIEPTIDLSEMETGNMVKILEILSTRYLEMLVEKLEDQEKELYSNALFDMRSETVTWARICEAQEYVMNTVQKFGKLVLFGDQLTVISILNCLLKYLKEK